MQRAKVSPPGGRSLIKARLSPFYNVRPIFYRTPIKKNRAARDIRVRGEAFNCPQGNV